MSDANRARLGRFFVWLEGVVVALALLGASFGALGLSAGQWAAVGSCAAAVVATVLSITAHLLKGTQREPVAVGASLTALVTTFLAMGSALEWWVLTADQQGALIGVLTAILGLGSGVYARGKVDAHSAPRPAEAGVKAP